VRQHIGVSFYEKSFIIPSILLVFKPNLVPKCTLYPFLMRAKFEGNPITRLHFMAVFCKCTKRRKRKGRKKHEENE